MKNGNTSNLSLNNEAVNLPYPFKFVNDEQSKNLEAKIIILVTLILNIAVLIEINLIIT